MDIEFDPLEETLSILNDPEAMASIRTSRKQAAAGDLVNIEDLFPAKP